MREPEGWVKVSRRMYDLGRSLNWKWKELDPALQVKGFTELNVGAMRDETLAYVITALQRGYVMKDGPKREMLRLLLTHGPKPVSIGYVGRTKMTIYLPRAADVSEIRQELDTMHEMGDKDMRIPFDFGETDGGEWKLTSRMYVHRAKGDGPPPAMYTRARKLLDTYLQEHIAHRQPTIDWVQTKPIVRIPFTSHTRDGAWR